MKPMEQTQSTPAPQNSPTVTNGFSAHGLLVALTFWFPYLGLVWICFFLLSQRSSSQQIQIVVGWVFIILALLTWAVGIALGSIALKLQLAVGHKSSVRRISIGLILNFLFLTLSIFRMITDFREWEHKTHPPQTELERNTEDQNKTEDRVANIAKEMQPELTRAGQPFQKIAQQLIKSPLLDMSQVATTNDLLARESLAEKFIGENRRFNEFVTNISRLYHDKLLQRGFTEKDCNRFAREFQAGYEIPARDLLEMEYHQGQLMLKILKDLANNWGDWNYDSKSAKLIFQRDQEAEEYSATLREMQALAVKIQEKVRVINTTEVEASKTN